MRWWWLLMGLSVAAPALGWDHGTGTDSFCQRHGCGMPTTVVTPCTPAEANCDPTQVCQCNCGSTSDAVATCERAAQTCAASVLTIEDVRQLLYRFHLRSCRVTRKGKLKCKPRRVLIFEDP